ncbi:CPBP family intramembrane metalloprotease [Gracilibacillus caseinilyticus]|uniref:CPBP family intramembrane metalloprotease n=1 Tax=Gracilibacillus caseinilyticus TaxID=2932256 RepID=A0ABY4EU01_9BACI|nr:CPBP family intramembrane glutamic endopeptidase [Gracilibacillus caseinilyticus]UOQ47551.1 CPBP family intramembrane metalloprotease [Gracilibacillus caseinilyticus]
MKNSQEQLIKKLSSKQLKQQIWLSQGLLLLLAITLMFIFFDSAAAFFNLLSWSWSQIVFYSLFSALIIVGIDIMTMYIFPKKWWDDGGVNEKIFKQGSYIEIIVLCFCIALVEEWLFRGIVQTQFGLWIASIIFALVHTRYLAKPFLFIAVILLSFWIGLVYQWTGNLTTVIALHFFVDLFLALLIRTRGVQHAR